ncbi:high mobility group B protein 7-like isoform X1 [Telopea speciosissima]|uniref:high mobility group B protein 7-like isoform X1 n=1 Tax=Telopea speciosissima TaxID=54955 RepID=UPI001CC713B6|nr:high mobility group B protein 7-like isoform X1 [Telopea speciosissima]
MAGSTSKSIPPKGGKRVEVDTNVMKRAKDGSAFTRCEECNKDVPVVLIDMHNCSIESRIKMKLEAVERATEVKKPAEKKRKPASSEPKAKKSKSGKKVKDPNAPKRPPTAFFLFMDDFRKSYKEENPDGKDVKVVAKEGGAKWKSLTDEEKQTYIDRVQELKEEYEKALETYKEQGKQEEEEEQDEQGDAGSEKEE